MDEIPNELETVAEEVKQGEERTVSVRELLSWFDSQRRGRWVVQRIRKALREVDLETKPNFEVPHIDAEVEFQEWTGEEDEEDSESDEFDFSDPVPRLGQLDAASRSPETVNRDDRVSKAVTVMMMNNFSQLPVLQGERSVDGYISWETIGRNRTLGDDPTYVRECMEEDVEVLKEATPLFEAIPLIAEKEFILVEGNDKRIIGLVTISDIILEFSRLAEHFLQIGVIENHLRHIIDENFEEEVIREAADTDSDDREVESVADLTFGESVRILENEDNWDSLNFELERVSFCERMDEIRRIRNEVMHFHPDDLADGDKEKLEQTVRFMQNL
jgi:CBS domain-containing protein